MHTHTPLFKQTKKTRLTAAVVTVAEAGLQWAPSDPVPEISAAAAVVAAGSVAACAATAAAAACAAAQGGWTASSAC